ncbi:MAG: hypothetical protein ACLR0P_05985 [Oscillospiraceae bacterium]
MKDQANDTIQAMADYTVTEAQIENLVSSQGLYRLRGLHWGGTPSVWRWPLRRSGPDRRGLRRGSWTWLIQPRRRASQRTG